MHYFISRLRIATSRTRFSKISDPKSHLSNCNLHVLKSCFFERVFEDCEVWRLRTPVLRRYEGNCGTRNRLKSFGTFEKQALGSWDVLTPKTHCMLWPPHDQVLTPFLRPYWMNEGKKFVLFLSHSESLKEPVTVLGTRIPNTFLLIFFFDFWLVSFIRTHFFFFERLWKAESASKNMEFKVRDK